MEGDDLFKENRLGARDVLDCLTGDGLGQEADEVARMPGFERNANLAVGLEPADAGAVACARIDDHKRPERGIELYTPGRDDPCQAVIDRPIQLPTIDYELNLVIEDMRGGLLEVLAILKPALSHDVPEQDGSLRGVDHVLDRGGEGRK